MKIEIFRINTENILDAIAKYQSAMESQLESIQAEELKNIGARNALLTSEREVMLEMAQEEYTWTYDYMFPRSVRYSFIVLLFLVVESQLVLLCEDLRDRGNFSERVQDLNGEAISRCKEYLTRVAGLPDNHLVWEKIKDLAKVRNCIVHALGKVDRSPRNTHLRQLAGRGIGLTISDAGMPEEGVLVVARAVL